jgi:protein-disulfide isomerase
VSDITAPGSIPAGATPDGDGIVVADGLVPVDAFIDFLCPYCRQFELSAGPGLQTMAAAGRIRLVYHPMSFLDDASTTRYSSRAGAASGCASDGGKFELAELGRAVGLPAQAITSCLLTGKYLDWPPYVTAVATARGVESTPTILVGGAQVPADGQAIAAAVAAARAP